jgi:hypothetical protein
MIPRGLVANLHETPPAMVETVMVETVKALVPATQ